MSIKNVELWLEQRGEMLKTKAACVFPSGWKPELDVTPLLSDEEASYFQQQIGVLRWKAACVFPSGWKPELDITPLLGDEDAFPSTDWSP